ncbi:tetratricopeptide repeat protein [Candidatus Poribacteria bacterium]|nr:tetratricopeptide repeat protein [Candidatus Poribacteria bacterium]
MSLYVFLLLYAFSGYTQTYVIVEMQNGDKLTGQWLDGNDTHFRIEYNEQIVQLPIEGTVLSFTTNLDNLPNQAASKHYRNARDLLDLLLPDLAIRQFEKALEESPKFVDAHYQLGILYNTNEQFDKALDRFQSVAIIDSEKYTNLPNTLQEIGTKAIESEDYANAVKAFQIILTYYPEHESIGPLSYITGFLLVENLDDPISGLALLQETASEFPNLPQHEKAVFVIGNLQAKSEDLENALRTLEKFVELYPTSEFVDDAYLKQAIIHLQLGEREDAVNIAQGILRITDDQTIIDQAKDVRQASAWNIYTQDLPDTNIQALVVDGTSLWIGTPKGIVEIETQGIGKWHVNEAIPWKINEDEQLTSIPDVRAIAVNSLEVWIGTRNQGIIHYNKNTKAVTNYTIADGLPSMWIRDIKMDDKEIWFATDAGLIRRDLSTGIQHLYNYENHNIPDDLHSINMTPDTIWVGSSGEDISIYDRKLEEWEPIGFVDLNPEIKIIRFDSIGNKTFFSYVNEEEKSNGYFESDWFGSNASTTPISTGTEDLTLLDDIFITGIAESTIPQPNFVDEDNQTSRLTLWLALSDYVGINHDYTQTPDWDGTIGYPKVLVEGLTIQCISVDNDRIWIGTTKGMLTLEKEKFSETIE